MLTTNTPTSTAKQSKRNSRIKKKVKEKIWKKRKITVENLEKIQLKSSCPKYYSSISLANFVDKMLHWRQQYSVARCWEWIKRNARPSSANERKWRKMRKQMDVERRREKLRPNQLDTIYIYIDAARKSSDWLFLLPHSPFLVLFVYWFYHWNTYITQTMMQSIEQSNECPEIRSECSTNYGHFPFFLFYVRAPAMKTANVILFIDGSKILFFIRPHSLANFNCSFWPLCDCRNVRTNILEREKKGYWHKNVRKKRVRWL